MFTIHKVPLRTSKSLLLIGKACNNAVFLQAFSQNHVFHIWKDISGSNYDSQIRFCASYSAYSLYRWQNTLSK